MSKALFLDRDGTLMLDKNYLADPAGVEILPGAADALRSARSLGYKLFLFTNQSGIGRGLYTLDDAERCNARLEELLGLPRPVFDDICIAPESSEQPLQYRKPSPRFILESISRHSLDRDHCWMVGDREADIEAGLGAKIHVAAVCTGKNSAEGWAALGLPGVPVFANLAEFVATLAPPTTTKP
ncbi:MAG: HAD-IIIA family hydrolase [Verrucomicrobia bacterium]|nr:HAD-IIIA family hydrolase [Verrucomicrobiota bacterium]